MGKAELIFVLIDMKCMLILCSIIIYTLCCTDFSCAKTKTYTVNSWSDDNWTFAGFAIGPNSGDHYHLLSDPNLNDCAIIRETATGTVQWNKFYHRKACRSLVINPAETNCYFGNDLNTPFGISIVNCTDGSAIANRASGRMRVNIGKYSMSISDTGNTIYISGSIYRINVNKFYHCRYNTSTPTFECALRPNVGNSGASSDAVGLYTDKDDWMYMIAFDSTVGHYAVKLDSDLNYLWMTGIDCTTPNPNKCLASTNGYSDSDGTNIHSAYTLQDSPKYTLYLVLDINTGSNVTVVQRTSSDQDIEISSLYVDSNGVTWINLYTNTSSGYSELISYDMSSGNTTTYKQTGVAYFYQFVDPTNDNYWYGISFKSYITEAKLDSMDHINLLNVTAASGGLIAADETYNISVSFPSINSWETISNFNTKEQNMFDFNVTITTSIDDPVEPETNSTNETNSNSTNETNSNSTNETNTNPIEEEPSTPAVVNNATTPSAAITTVTTTSVAVAGATAGFVCIAVIITSSSAGAGAAGDTSSPSSGSKQSLWAMVNLYQEILLIPMLGTYLGDDFLYYITEFKIALFDFKFLKSVQIPVLESGPSFVDDLDFEQPDELFADNEFESGSAFFNCFQITKAMLIFFLFNMAFLVYKCIIDKTKPERDIWYRVYDWFADFFHFTVYLRLLIESSMFIFISCMLEVSQFDNIADNKASYSLAIIVFILTFMFLIIPIHYFKYCCKGIIETRYLAEIYDGFKDTHASKLYMFMFLLKRFLMACVIVFLRNANVWLRCILFTIIQFSVLLYLIIVRPFDCVKNNLIEPINEATCLILSIVITIHNDESKWFDGLDGYLIYFLVLVGLVISGIINIEMIVSCVQNYREKKAKKRAEQYLENAEEPMEHERRSTEEQAIHQESESNQSYSQNQNQNKQKTHKQGEYSNIQNNPAEDGNVFNMNR